MEHPHFSSDGYKLTHGKCLLNLLLRLGVYSARYKGLNKIFTGSTLRLPGAY